MCLSRGEVTKWNHESSDKYVSDTQQVSHKLMNDLNTRNHEIYRQYEQYKGSGISEMLLNLWPNEKGI
jgi:hypothetical protein